MRLLVAEDDPRLRKTLVHIFEQNKFSVDAVSNGEDALKVVRFRHNNDGSGYPMQDLDRIKTQQAFLQAMVDDVATLEEHGLEVTYPDREEMKAAGGGVIDEYCAEYPEFDDVMTKIEALQEEYRANNVSTADTAA